MIIKYAKVGLIILIPVIIALSSYLLIGRPHAAFAGSDRAYSWGLSHRGGGHPPVATGGDLLTQNNGIYLGDTAGKTVYLTFDLGYEAGYTDAVLDTLKSHDIKAIFFLCGHYLKETELVERMISEGHIIGNHTDKHKDLPSLSREGATADIDMFTEKYSANFNAPVKHFRPPQGRFNRTVLEEVAKRNMKTVMWSLAIVDWGKTPINAEACAKKITERIHPGAVILLHISNAGTHKMLNLLVPMLQENGYTFGDATSL